MTSNGAEAFSPAQAFEDGAYWNRSPESLLAELHSAPEGLGAGEAQARLEAFGRNLLEARKRATTLGLIWDQFKSPIVLILLFATVLSAALGNWLDAVIILVIVLGSAALSFWQEYSASNAAQRLRAQVMVKATVLRDGQRASIPAEEVVPGDVVLLSAGDLVPADGILLEARDLFVNQAVLTGETFPVEKETGVVKAGASLPERTNCVFMGTSVRSGTGHALMVQTGTATSFGRIANRLTLRPPETEFERGIRHLGLLLTQVMFVLVLAVFAINVFFQKPVLDSLLFSVALAVGLTPQLLPAIINVNLSRGSQAMAAKGVIVRRLAAIENFGSMDVLCTDKTGTLTEGVVRLDGALDVEGQASDEVMRYAHLNARLQTGLSNPLDEAILAHDPLDMTGVHKLDEVPYDFVRKRLSVVVQDSRDEGAAPLIITKGALETVLEVCTEVQRDGEAVSLDSPYRAKIRQRYAQWSSQGYRVLGVAIRAGDSPDRPYTRADEHGLTFAGFLLFFDPPKAGVLETVADLEKLGVGLKIITGDNRLVAQHTARAVGLAVTGLLTGAELDDLRDEALWRAVESANLFCEVDPNQKERIILAAQKMDHVVGYMGDGINDAPALHAADVGISVDSAVDVAKEAADLVLVKGAAAAGARHSLGVLHQGILEGRRTFANTLKYVFMATSANFGNMFSVAGASLFLPYLPMLPKQILLINFLTDLPEMTIATDRVDPSFVERPHRWDVGFIRRFMLVFGPLSSVFDFLAFGVFLLLLRAGQAQFRTGWFIESVVSAGLVVFVLRSRLPVLRSVPSRAMAVVTAVVIVVTVAIPYSPLAGLLGFEALPPIYLLAIALIVALYFTSAEFTKRLFYRAHLDRDLYTRSTRRKEREHGRRIGTTSP
jgi:Mg2+-importing ATPase